MTLVGKYPCPECGADLIKTGFHATVKAKLTMNAKLDPGLGPLEGWRELAWTRDYSDPIEIGQCFCDGCNCEVTQVVDKALAEMWRSVGQHDEEKPKED